MKKVITFITMLCLLTTPVMAQATYQSLFNEGKSLYNKAKTQWSNRNSAYKTTCTQAINKFKLAKNKTKNQTEIQTCNKWISTCQTLQNKALPAQEAKPNPNKRLPDWQAITITGITFATSDEEGNLTSSYGDRLYSNLQYVKAKVSFRNNVKDARDHIDIKVKMYKPDGTLDGNGSYTFEDYLRADGNYKKDDFDYTLGWGNKSGKSYTPGTYRYEIWIGTHKMYTAYFTVYQAQAGSSSGSGSASAARGMSNDHWRTVLSRCLENPSRTFGGDPYKGQLLNNDCEGYGAYKWESSESLYFGKWSNGERNGYGISICGPQKCYFSHNDAEIFVGNCSNGSFADGKATIYDAKGNLKYYGAVANKELSDTYPSSGDWSEFKFECISYNDGAYYIGETYKGDRHGYGIYVWKDKGFWIGNWSYGKRKGAGAYIKYNGTVQTGTWEGDTYTASSSSGSSGSSSASGGSSSARGMSNSHWRTVLGYCFENPSRTFNGDPYKGGMYNNDCQDFGAYKWNSSKSMYFGLWDNGERDGEGLHICGEGYHLFDNDDAKFFIGEYSNGSVADGNGTIYDKNGYMIYYGEFKNGKPTGSFISNPSGSSWKFECISYNNGDYYIGETHEGKPRGYGVYVWKNKDFWMGRWSEGKRSGKGMYVYYNGNVLTGRWNGDTRTD